MKVLVTGGAGFIGSHIAEAVCRRGARVVILDNLSYGSLSNLSWRKTGDQVEFVGGDICNTELLDKILPGCEWVFHQAALASVPYSVAEPEITNRQNLDATLNLLALARKHNVRRFVFASSCSLYGDLSEAATEASPVNPLSPYALQKFASERYAQFFATFHGVPTVALRYFNVFGPRQSASSPYSGVIALFCQCVLGRKPPTIFGDGLQTRDFVSVRNVVEANLRAAESDKAPGNVYNIGTGASTSVLDLWRAVNRAAGTDIQPAFGPTRAGDIRFSAADISRAREQLGYDPKVSLEEGLAETLAFYRVTS